MDEMTTVAVATSMMLDNDAAAKKKAAMDERMAKARAAAKANREAKADDPLAAVSVDTATAIGEALAKALAAKDKPKQAPPPKVVEKRVKLTVQDSEETPGEGDTKRHFFGHNGRSWAIPMGIEVNVPEGVINVIKDAKVSIPVIDPVTKKATGAMRDRNRFSWTVRE